MFLSSKLLLCTTLSNGGTKRLPFHEVPTNTKPFGCLLRTRHLHVNQRLLFPPQHILQNPSLLQKCTLWFFFASNFLKCRHPPRIMVMPTPSRNLHSFYNSLWPHQQLLAIWRALGGRYNPLHFSEQTFRAPRFWPNQFQTHALRKCRWRLEMLSTLGVQKSAGHLSSQIFFEVWCFATCVCASTRLSLQQNLGRSQSISKTSAIARISMAHHGTHTAVAKHPRSCLLRLHTTRIQSSCNTCSQREIDTTSNPGA